VVVAVLSQIALGWFGATGSGTGSVALAVPSGCPSFTQVDAHGLLFTEPPTASCSGDTLDFGIPGGAPGAQGDPGPAGADGADGAIGPPGPQGEVGLTGATGATGPAGANGQSITSADATDCRGTGRPGSFFNGVSGGTWACDGATGPQGAKGDTGSQGPQGATGPQGAQGPAGPAGADGVSGYQLVTNSTSCPPDPGFFCGPLEAQCPSGKKPLGGGTSVASNGDTTANNRSIRESKPTSDGWLATWFGSTNQVRNATTMSVFAICASVGS
jgi:hypothetical protein